MRFNPSINAAVTNNIQQSEQALQTAFQQVSTGLRVNQPSDDPSASAAYIQLQAQAANVDQYTANASSALSQAQLSDQVVSQVVSYLTQAVTLGTEGANSTSSASDRQSIATNVLGILSNVVGLANQTFQGVSLFGGTANGTAAYTLDTTTSPATYTYNGNTSVNQIKVGDSLSVQANIPGSTLFDNAGSSVLGALSNLAHDLTTGGTSAQIGTDTAAISTALNYVTTQHAVYGNTINQLTSQETYLSQETVTLTSSAKSLVGIDTATAAENLTQAETANSSVLAAAARVIQNTLLNYLQ
jgi:flagellar hook-associated protein 3 FlgL